MPAPSLSLPPCKSLGRGCSVPHPSTKPSAVLACQGAMKACDLSLGKEGVLDTSTWVPGWWHVGAARTAGSTSTSGLL